MKRSLLLILLLSATASADPSAPEAAAPTAVMIAAASTVRAKLLAPLATREQAQSRFSRGRLPPRVRRVRILDAQPRKDALGAAFVAFAVDERHGMSALTEPLEKEAGWTEGALTGCVYLDGGGVFVKRGDAFRPAELLLGKKLPAAPAHVCQGEPTRVATQ
jgi:hypothetical protein